MSKLKTVFFGSPSFAAEALQCLLLQHRPEIIVCPPPRPAGRGQSILKCSVQDLAEKKGIEVWNAENINEPSFQNKLKDLAPDIFIVVAFGQILKPPTLAIPKMFSLNVHASLLPRWRGAAPIQYAIWEGDAETGVTVQKMVLKLDAGDILLQKKVKLSPSDTTASLMSALGKLGGEALVEALAQIESKKFTFYEQNDSEVTLAPKIEKEAGLVNWKESAEKIERQMRAFQPWPGIFFKLGDQTVKIIKVKVEAGEQKPGTIETDKKSFLKIYAQTGALSILEVQPQNKKAMGIKEYLNAFRGEFPYNQVSL